jgi:hypothetical protein
MTTPESITFFIDRCLGTGTVPEKLRNAGILVEIHAVFIITNFSSIS